MKNIIEKAIYYSDIQQHSTIHFEYSDKDSFQKVINSLTSDIDVITFFAPKNDLIYSILNETVTIYENLLLDKISCIYLVNRKDIIIKITHIFPSNLNKDEIVEQNNEIKQRAAVLKVDSIFSEFYSQKKEASYFNYSLTLILGGILGVSALSFFKNRI